MHDPMTQAFVIPYGWKTEYFKNGTKWRYWKPLVTIWHVDPELHGSDDSCGWFTPPFTARQKEIVEQLAGDEARSPWFMSLPARSNRNPVECEAYVRGAFLIVSRCLENSGFRRGVSLEEATKWASILVHNSIDNFRSSLAFLSGYHSNRYRDRDPNTEKEDEFFRKREALSFFGAVMGYILRERRHWWQHPKWHIHHWEFQVHLLQSFKRWAFSRCCKCGGHFSWGYSPYTNSWNSSGPSWFKSESDVFHLGCDHPKSEDHAVAE